MYRIIRLTGTLRFVEFTGLVELADFRVCITWGIFRDHHNKFVKAIQASGTTGFREWGWGLGFRGLGFRVHEKVETSARFTGLPHTVLSSKKTEKRDMWQKTPNLKEATHIFLCPYGMALTFT